MERWGLSILLVNMMKYIYSRNHINHGIKQQRISRNMKLRFIIRDKKWHLCVMLIISLMSSGCREKNSMDGSSINAGYMVLEPSVFDYIDGDAQPFEREPLERLAKEGELMSYIHEGFWQCMDNIREKNLLEGLLANGTAPWKKWEREVPKV